MKPVLSRIRGPLLCGFVPALALSATTSYEYDALGRLRVVTHDNRVVTTYTLDPAGNRTRLTDGADGTPPVPPAPTTPAAPTNLTKTHIANCAWRATWSAVSGATNYIVRDTAGVEQSVTVLVAHVSCPLNNQNANQPRWVKACVSATSCSTAAYFP